MRYFFGERPIPTLDRAICFIALMVKVARSASNRHRTMTFTQFAARSRPAHLHHGPLQFPLRLLPLGPGNYPIDDEILSWPELDRLASYPQPRIRKIRITGGERSSRASRTTSHVSTPMCRGLSMTTNGTAGPNGGPAPGPGLPASTYSLVRSIPNDSNASQNPSLFQRDAQHRCRQKSRAGARQSERPSWSRLNDDEVKLSAVRPETA